MVYFLFGVLGPVVCGGVSAFLTTLPIVNGPVFLWVWVVCIMLFFGLSLWLMLCFYQEEQRSFCFLFGFLGSFLWFLLLFKLSYVFAVGGGIAQAAGVNMDVEKVGGYTSLDGLFGTIFCLFALYLQAGFHCITTGVAGIAKFSVRRKKAEQPKQLARELTRPS